MRASTGGNDFALAPGPNLVVSFKMERYYARQITNAGKGGKTGQKQKRPRKGRVPFSNIFLHRPVNF